MSQNDIEVSLAQQLAEYLAMPIFIVDPSGDMLFFNESAEVILGCQYHEIETVPASEWPTVFAPLNFESRLLEPKELPLIIAMTKHHPDQKRLRVVGKDRTAEPLKKLRALIGDGGDCPASSAGQAPDLTVRDRPLQEQG